MTEPIRVLRVIARLNVGGPALQITNLERGLGPPAFDTRLLAGSVASGEADYVELRAPDLQLTRVPGLGPAIRPGDDLRALRTLVAEIRRFRPHIVHTHTAKAGILGRTAARLCRVPVIVHTFHGHLLRGYFSPTKTAAVRRAEAALAKISTKLVAVGEQVRDDLIQAGIGRPDQYVVFPPGIELPPPPSRLAARGALGLPLEAEVVVFVGRVTAVKRPDRFAEVARLVAHARPNALFVIVGEGDRLPDLRAAMASGQVPAVFLGWRSDVEIVYAAADVVALTSDNEGMPVSLIESSMVGTPCVTTDVGSAREVVIDGVTGLVTDLTSAAVAGALISLLEDRDRRLALGLAARSHAERNFSAARLVRDHASLYAALVAR